METTIEKFEAMFLKSKADLEYIEKRLKLDFINNSEENGCPAEENPAVMLENLRALKAKHTVLCSQVRDIAAAQKESMDSIRNNLSSVIELLQHLQQSTDVEVDPLMESLSVQESAQLLGLPLTETITEMPPSGTASDSQQPTNFISKAGDSSSCSDRPQSNLRVHHCSSGRGCELSEAILEVVPLSIRSNLKLAELNRFYQQLQLHFSKDNSGSLSVLKMKQLKMKVSDVKLRVLQHLSLVEMDKRGNVRLVM